MSHHAQDPSVPVAVASTDTALVPVAAPLIFTFTNGKPHAVRVMTDAQGEPLFHVGDLCDLLEHVNPREALRRHVETDDVTKRDVIDRLGRTQLANFVNEAGMWSLLLGSHAPNAKKVKRWVTGEVLPAIRKTGRYIAPQAQPEPAPDPTNRLTNAEQSAISRFVWQICRGRHFEKAWSFGAWAAIRRVTGTKAPSPLEVEHLPATATELERIYTAVTALDDAVNKCEKEFLKRVFRNGEDAAVVIAQIEAQILTTALPLAADFANTLHAWQRRDIQELRARKVTDRLPATAYPEGLEQSSRVTA